MALLYFGGMDRYAVSTTAVALPLNRAAIPFPTMQGLKLRLNGLGCGFKVENLPNVLETGVTRNWVSIVANTSSATASAQYFELTWSSVDIPDEYKVVDNVLCLGFRYRSHDAVNAYRYLAFCKLTATQNLNTGIGGLTSSMVFPLEVGALHPLTTKTTQEKYIELRVRYRENNVCLIKMFVNKDLVYTTEVGWDEAWAILAGSPRTSGHWVYSTSGSKRGTSCFNDIYMSVDKKGDKATTGMIGPVTAKALELEEPVIEGDWLTSNPDKSIKDILSTQLANQAATMSGDYVITDPGDRPTHFKFKPPIGEKLKIVGFQQGFIAQQPLAYSTSLQYMQTVDGVSIEPGGYKTTINVTLEPGYAHVRSPAISTQPDGSDLTPEYLGTIGISLNSTKKMIEDDPIPEEEVPEEEVI